MLISLPSLNDELSAQLTEIVDNLPTPPELPQVWHYAAFLSILSLDSATVSRMASKWVPDDHASTTDCELILDSLNHPDLPPSILSVYTTLVQVWRYNSFGHHTDSNALCMYDITSNMSHSCAASAVWHFGDLDGFCLRARTNLVPGDEVSISYLGDEDLFRSVPARRVITAGWLFECACDRCSLPCDFSRAFRCTVCCVGSIFATHCTTCNSFAASLEEQIKLEALYIDRVLAIDKTDYEDISLVLSESLNLFTEYHWIVYFLKSYLPSTILSLSDRIAFQTRTFSQINYATAWLVEELGDLLVKSGDTVEAAKQYERSYWMLRVLCGSDHPFTDGIQTKWQDIAVDKS